MAGVDQLLVRRRRIGQDAEPPERIGPIEDREHAVGDRRPADAVEAVTAGDQVGFDRRLLSAGHVADRRPRRIEPCHAYVLGLEHDRQALTEPDRDHVLDHLVLAVDRHTAAREARKIDAVPSAAKAQLDAVVHHPFAPEPDADARILEHVDAALLEQAGANAALDVDPRAILKDNGVDALACQQVRQQQPSRPGTDDADLCSQARLPAADCSFTESVRAPAPARQRPWPGAPPHGISTGPDREE